MAWDARAADISDGLGAAPAAAADFPRPLLLFLEWTGRAVVASRFEAFYESCSHAFAGDDGDDDYGGEEEEEGKEQSLAQHAAFLEFERFFAAECGAFFEETRVDEEEFERVSSGECEASKFLASWLRHTAGQKWLGAAGHVMLSLQLFYRP
jgi:hypothetical protein